MLRAILGKGVASRCSKKPICAKGVHPPNLTNQLKKASFIEGGYRRKEEGGTAYIQPSFCQRGPRSRIPGEKKMQSPFGCIKVLDGKAIRGS